MDSSWPILVFLPHQDLNFPCIVPVEYSDGSNMREVISNADMAPYYCGYKHAFCAWWSFPHSNQSTQVSPLQIPQFGIVSSSQHFKDKYSGIPKQQEEPKEIEKLHSPEFWNTCNFQLFDGFLSKWGNHGAAAENNESTLDHWSANIEGRISKIHN